MTLLLDDQELRARRTIAAGPLNELAHSLATDLHAVMARGVEIPDEKARLTRRGGRCELDGSLLEFHPWSPRKHLCKQCGRVFDADEHYRWWVMGFQLWLAERTVHAATLFAVSGDTRYSTFAERVLAEYADRYLEYPNRDNVLGPTRLFFSTYLESIWLLQLAVAVDLLERSGAATSLGATVRERIIEPSARLIASYDEGMSNRQVWNNAALGAAARLLGEPRWFAHSVHGPSGLTAHLEQALLADGSWYEGENYHLFAHRGLWYGVELARVAGEELPPALLSRFDEGFATPFLTVLPDFTFPSRRDSQYAVSLRQWRFAELCELGLARRPHDARLVHALATLYEPDGVPRRDTGRWRSTAEAERNSPATSLSRADLGWRSLLVARPELPPLERAPQGSVLLEAQGFAVIRRDAGATYAALDYGHSGAGHGHPDRLSLLLMRGAMRCLDDAGTGSYVDPSLHWYRSTLAHNAPLFDGHSQQRVAGQLLAFEDRGGAGWVRAIVDGIAPGVQAERSIVVMPGYLVDQLSWRAAAPVTVDLPYHADGAMHDMSGWEQRSISGGDGLEDGFQFVTASECAAPAGIVRLDVTSGDDNPFTAWLVAPAGAVLWRCVAPGPPGSPPRRFHCIRVTDTAGGTIRSVWNWNGDVASVSIADHIATVHLHDGSRHEHSAEGNGWHVALHTGDAHSSIDLGGARLAAAATPDETPGVRPARSITELTSAPLAVEPPSIEHSLMTLGHTARHFMIAESHYRRSEDSWTEAGSPAAAVTILSTPRDLLVEIDVEKSDLMFAPASEWNPLDNEHPDTNSDGVQLHLALPPDENRRVVDAWSWILVPEPGGVVRVTPRLGKATGIPVASWTRLAAGYRLRVSLDRESHGLRDRVPFLLDVLVNETTPARERRRGQLVLSGARGHWVYLRGDRQDPADMLPVVIVGPRAT